LRNPADESAMNAATRATRRMSVLTTIAPASGRTHASKVTETSASGDPFARARNKLIDSIVVNTGIDDPRILGAFAKVPRHLFVREAFPRTPLGKVQKFRLREEALAEINRQSKVAAA